MIWIRKILTYFLYALIGYLIEQSIGSLLFGEFDFSSPLSGLLRWFVIIVVIELVLPRLIHKISGQGQIP